MEQISKYVLCLVLIMTLASSACAQMKEADYANIIQQHLGGQREVSVTSGRVDLVTDTFAYEIEWANKWKESKGQALWYGLQTSKQPGI